MKFFVTGAAGFIGAFTAKALLEKGHEVVGLDSLNDYYAVSLKNERLRMLSETAEGLGNASYWHFIKGNVEDSALLEKIFSEHRFDRVIHLAAQAGVRYSIENPFAYCASNLEGFLSILEACRKAKVAHLAYASSSSVYGMNTKVPFVESDAVDHPVSLYAATKRANELMAHTYAHLYGLPVTGMRFFTVYGPMGRPDMAYFKFAQAIMKGEPIDVYNHGDLQRDFTYIDDIVKAVVMISLAIPTENARFDPLSTSPCESSAPFKIYNIGNEHPEKLEYFISTLEACLGKKAVKNYLPMQQGDVYCTSADTSALEKDFGWKPSTSLKTGLERFSKWFLEKRNL